MQTPGHDFQQLHDAFRPRVLRYLTRLIGPADAEDVAQAVLLRVAEGLPAFRGEASVSTWIYRIATNAAFDQMRRVRRDAAVLPEQMPADLGAGTCTDPLLDESAFAVPSAETAAIRTEMNACIREFVDRLPEPYKAVILLSEYEGFTNAEIAGILGISLATVKIRLHRARERLRAELARGCRTYRDERGEVACERVAGPVMLRRSP